jgi:hypothetical protein
MHKLVATSSENPLAPVAIDFVQHLAAATGTIFFGHVSENRPSVSLHQGLEPFEVVIYRVIVTREN